MPTRQERIEGGLLGLLVGDALGVPYEFQPPARIPARRRRSSSSRPTGYPRAHAGVPPGTYSDDGAQALCLLASLLDRGRLDPDDLARRLLDWYETGYLAVDGQVFDVGIQTSQAFRALKAGTPALEAGPADERANGNGSLMRVLPLALWHKGTDAELVEDACTQSVVTHGHVRSQLCCALYCLWARRTLEGVGRPLARGRRRAPRWSWPTTPRGSTSWTPRSAPTTPPSRPAGATSSTACSRPGGRRPPGTFEQVVKAAVALGHDTDTTAAVAGGIAGLRDGRAGHPRPLARRPPRPRALRAAVCRALVAHAGLTEPESGPAIPDHSHSQELPTRIESAARAGRLGGSGRPGTAVHPARDGRQARNAVGKDSRRDARRRSAVVGVLAAVPPRAGRPRSPGAAAPGGGGAGLRHDAAERPHARPPPLHRRLRLHRRRLAAGRPAPPARAPRPEQAPGRPLPRPGPQRHLLDDHRPADPPPRAAPGARLRGVHLRLPRLGREQPRRRDRQGQRAGSARPSCSKSARAAGPSTRSPATTSPPCSTTSRSATGSDRVNWVGHSLGGMLMFAFLETLARPRPGRQLRGDGRDDRVRQVPPDRHAPGQPQPPAARLGGQPRPARAAADVRPLPRPRPDRPVLLHVGQRRPDHRLPVLRLHAGRHRPRGPGAARPLPGVRPLRLGRPHVSTTPPGSARSPCRR